MKFIVALLTLFATNTLAVEHLVKDKKCTVVYSLNGLSHSIFNDQINHLSRHLDNKNVQLIDMNQWQSHHPHRAISGRDRALLRKRFVMQKNKNTAVIVNKFGTVIDRVEDTVNLVDLLMQCSDGSVRQSKRAMASRH